MHGKEVAITEALKAIFCARLGEKEGETKWEGGTVCAKVLRIQSHVRKMWETVNSGNVGSQADCTQSGLERFYSINPTQGHTPFPDLPSSTSRGSVNKKSEHGNHQAHRSAQTRSLSLSSLAPKSIIR